MAKGILDRGLVRPQDRAGVRLNMADWYRKAENWSNAEQALRDNLTDLAVPSPYASKLTPALVAETKRQLVQTLSDLGRYEEAAQLGEELLANSTLDDPGTIMLLSHVTMAYANLAQQPQALATLDRMQGLHLKDPANNGFMWDEIALVRANLKSKGLALPPKPAGAPVSTVVCCDD